MSITPAAVATNTITAADENTRNSEVSTKYNAHTHNDLTQTSSVSFLFGSGTSSGTNMTLTFGNSTNVPAIRWNGTLDAFQYTEDQSTWITLPMTQGTSGQFLRSSGAGNIPVWAAAGGDAHQSDSAIGVTSSPTTTSTSYVDLTDMSVTLTTDANPTLFLFSGTFSSDVQILNIILDIDGSDKAATQRTSSAHAASEEEGIAITYLETLTAASHTAKVQWKVGAGTGTASGIQRTFVMLELK